MVFTLDGHTFMGYNQAMISSMSVGCRPKNGYYGYNSQDFATWQEVKTAIEHIEQSALDVVNGSGINLAKPQEVYFTMFIYSKFHRYLSITYNGGKWNLDFWGTKKRTGKRDKAYRLMEDFLEKGTITP